MTKISNQPETEPLERKSPNTLGLRYKVGALIVAGLVVGGVVYGPRLATQTTVRAAVSAPPAVTVSVPLQKELSSRLQFLGQFSAVDRVDLRAQVGGTLTQISFKDGQTVRKGELLFQIDPTPYQIKLNQAVAQLASAKAHLKLATEELARAQTLKQTDAGTTENVEQKAAEEQTAQAAVQAAQESIHDAQFDLDRCHITAPFTGRIGSHQVSVGSLVSGSRAGSGPTTLLATLVSLNPIYLDFDMSEADYLEFLRQQKLRNKPLNDTVDAALSDEDEFKHSGSLNFIDNTLDRSSGTIHARATISNADLLLTPGVFARVRLPLAAPSSVLLVPDDAVLPDQSDHIVLTVGPDQVVKPKTVQLGDLRGGLRVVRSGLKADDMVVIGGIVAATPGSKVSTQTGTIRYGIDQSRSSVQQ